MKKTNYLCISFHGELPDETMAALAEAFLRLTPDLTLRGFGKPGIRRAIFLEVSRCLSLYSEDSLEARVLRILREWKIAPDRTSIGRSSSLVRAWLLASHRVAGEREEASIARLPITAIAEVIDPLGVRAAAHPEEKGRVRALIEVLFLLGVRTLGALEKLPPDSAVSRFGELYETAIRNLEEDSTLRESWQRFRPIEKIIERTDLDPTESIWEIEPALFETKSLLDRVLRRAAGRGKAVAKIALRLECEPRKNIRENWSEVRIEFPFPQTSSLRILRSLREKLAYEFSRRPLDSPVMAMELEASELAPRRSAQSNFLDTEESRLESEREEFRDLVTELATKLKTGEEVFQAEPVAAWRPEKSWKRVLMDPEKISELPLPIPERPVEILTPPEVLRRLGRYLFWREERFRIRSFERVERLSGEWWESAGGFARTYYRVRTDERDLWVFREQTAGGEVGGIFLHGVF